MVYLLVESLKGEPAPLPCPSSAVFLGFCVQGGFIYAYLYIDATEGRSSLWKPHHRFFRDCCEAVPYAGLVLGHYSLVPSPALCDMRT